jgi:hypothetical protein
MSKLIAKLFIVSLIAVSFSMISSVSFAQSWQNSPNNSNSNNGVYDNQSGRTGHSVQRQDGSGVNIYNDQGNRTGYSHY